MSINDTAFEALIAEELSSKDSTLSNARKSRDVIKQSTQTHLLVDWSTRWIINDM